MLCYRLKRSVTHDTMNGIEGSSLPMIAGKPCIGHVRNSSTTFGPRDLFVTVDTLAWVQW
jgi:hypothetical protein